ncbi:MAG: YeeE/YedE family protein [Alcanivorax sp.]|nr:YeeE/YedE family protein [Alcanivorax sp.]
MTRNSSVPVVVSAFLIGLLFGIGLLVAGMANPAKVLAFLDLAGAWDPSLALVMGGAIVVGLVAFRVAGQRKISLLGEPMRLPTRRDVDKRLVWGSLGFGIGWGLAGFCPGPALVALGAGQMKAVVFVVAMLAGMALFELLERRPGKRPMAP